MYVELARSLLPVDEQQVPSVTMLHQKPFSDMATRFTLRESQIAALMLKGLTNKKIATELSISENTVEKHVTSVLNKLGIRSRYQLTEALTPA